MTEPIPEEVSGELLGELPDEQLPLPAPVDDVVAEEQGDLPRVESPVEARAVVEALLFASGPALSPRRLTRFLPGWSERQILDLLLDLQASYEDTPGGLMIQEIAGGWTMATRPRWADWVNALRRTRRRNPLTPQALEALAIIAYRQPITRADVEVVRGVDSGGMLRNLLDLNLITITGHRETIGRPPLYGTTDQFLRVFGLKSLSDLPSIDELRELLPREIETPEPVPIAEEGDGDDIGEDVGEDESDDESDDDEGDATDEDPEIR